jgi:AmmeMemoRadiSam system protein B
MQSNGTKVATRQAYHAGSWYTDDGVALDKQLDNWLKAARPTTTDPFRPSQAIISPHAGYSYSGPTAAYAYAQIDKNYVNRVFILGPSHHYGMSNCALSMQTHYETPLGDLPLDLAVINELSRSGLFCRMEKSVDEREHSIEMQLPYIRKVFEGKDIRIVPIMVGSLDVKAEEAMGKLLAPYFRDPSNFFVISSDFCHWGKRFSYRWYDKQHGEIYQSIEWLDREGMRCIETQQPQLFHQYRKQYKNTICGRHPIAILLQALQEWQGKYELKFVRYAQSSKCKTQSDSSVSYAAAVLRVLDAIASPNNLSSSPASSTSSSSSMNGSSKKGKKKKSAGKNGGKRKAREGEADEQDEEEDEQGKEKEVGGDDEDDESDA